MIEAVFSTRSLLRCYNQGQLAVRRLLGFSRYEQLLLEAGSWGQGQFENTEEGECLPLEAATK
jgi:hypothetical protein